jgi:DNA modification methylase
MSGPAAKQLGVLQNGSARPWSHHWSGKLSEGELSWNLYCGDAKSVLKALPCNHYSIAITSPPYFWQRDYKVSGQIGLERTVEGYVDAICDVMDEVRRVLSPKGLLFLNLGDTYYSGKGRPQGTDRKHNGRRMDTLRLVDASGLGKPKKTLLGMPWRIALAMIDRGWILRTPIIWRKEKAIPESNAVDRPWRTYEHIFMFSKSRTYHFDRKALKAARSEDIWTIESQSLPGRLHPAVFPSELVMRCLAIGNPEKGRVLDPFAGTGTVIKASLETGACSDGIELNRKYCVSAVAHLPSD